MTEKIVDRYISLRLNAFKGRPGSKESWVTFNYGAFLPTDRAAAIIEIGPGLGENIALLVDTLGYVNVSFVDNSAEVVERIASPTINGTLVNDLEQYFLKVPIGTFDSVIMFHVIEHLPREIIAPVLGAILRALKPGGSLLLETPNMENPLTAGMHRYHDFTHQLGFTSLSLQQVLKGAGFSTVMVFSARPKITGLARACQVVLQHIIEAGLKAIIRIYNPAYQSTTMSQFIGVVAIK